MNNPKEQTLEEQRRQFQHEASNSANDKVPTPTEIDFRHYAPIQAALPNEAAGYEWKRETGDIQSYQYNHTGGWLHFDPQGQFYDRQTQPIAREAALEHAGHVSSHSLGENAEAQSIRNSINDQGMSL